MICSVSLEDGEDVAEENADGDVDVVVWVESSEGSGLEPNGHMFDCHRKCITTLDQRGPSCAT